MARWIGRKKSGVIRKALVTLARSDHRNVLKHNGLQQRKMGMVLR